MEIPPDRCHRVPAADQTIYIKFISTHAEYGQVDAETVELERVRTQHHEYPPIHTQADYQATLREVSPLVDAAPHPNTPDGERLDVLVTLIEAYGARQYPIAAPDPIKAIKFWMEQEGLSIKDMEPIIGKPNRVYEVLNHKRPLTLAMVRQLHRALGIPTEVLIAETVVV